MVKFFALVVDNGIALLAGALIALIIEHGWGWVLAQLKAVKAKQAAAATQAQTTLAQQIQAALAPLQADIATIKSKLPQ